MAGMLPNLQEILLTLLTPTHVDNPCRPPYEQQAGANCMSFMGGLVDFASLPTVRPALSHADYKKLGVLKQQFPDTPIIALTATATLQASAALFAKKHFLRQHCL